MAVFSSQSIPDSRLQELLSLTLASYPSRVPPEGWTALSGGTSNVAGTSIAFDPGVGFVA